MNEVRSQNFIADRKYPFFIRFRILLCTISAIFIDLWLSKGMKHTVFWFDSELECVIHQSDGIYPRPILGTDCNRV